MTLNEYQEKAMTTCMPTSRNFGYMMLGLVEEVGELAGKISKGIRKGRFVIDDNEVVAVSEGIAEEESDAVKKEIGDCLWMLAGLCSIWNWKMEDIGNDNLAKLQARKEAGTISGHGDGIKGAERCGD